MSKREEPDAKTLGSRVVERLKRFTELLKSGVPIEATEVRVERTPDGPLTTRRHVVLNQQPAEEPKS